LFKSCLSCLNIQITMNRVLQGEDAFLDKGTFSDHEVLIRTCLAEANDQLEIRPEVIIFGKTCQQRRNVGFFSNDSIGYKYSKKLMKSKPLSESMIKLLEIVNTSFEGSNFNGLLVNTYVNGEDCIGAHSDDETGLGANSGVVSISYGAERIFRIRDKITKQIVHDEITTHCCILHMGGDFQKVYTHEVPVQKKVKETRYSITFRRHII
jgi:alkylated DNA repair dioxygenase AlkB